MATPPTQTMAGDEDPPGGDEIRRQVEYYFSNENLPSDLNLLKYCHGRKNEPVSINYISSFRKMKPFRKPKGMIAAALRHSSTLVVTPDGKKVSRKVPLAGLCALDPEFFDDDYGVAFDPSSPEVQAGKEKKKKKKKTQKPEFPVKLESSDKTVYAPGTSKGMEKPNGFEDMYAEPLLTPKQAAENDRLYHPDKPFIHRIEYAIQTFKEKRRMHEMYAHVFNKLMRFGGVESTPRLFQGVTEEEIKQWDAEEKARNMANHRVPDDRADENNWVVDFAALARAFLSSWYPAHYGYASNAIKNACQVPRSFYNYLRYHSVCPEYDDQLVEALKTCNIAEEELPKVHEAGLLLPGNFNKSASVIFGGAYAGHYTGALSWAEAMKTEGMNETGVRDEEARIKFGAGVAIMGTDEQYDKLEAKSLTILERVVASLEVVDIQLPTAETQEMYKEQDKISSHKVGALEPLGKLICKTWNADDCDEWDLPKDKYPTGKPYRVGTGQTYEFWVEQNILKTCFTGLKMDAKVLTLDGGMSVLDDVQETLCSFFTWLPNELWMEKKPKEVRWMDKKLPGVEDLVQPEEAQVTDEEQTAAGIQDAAQAAGQEDMPMGDNENDHRDGAFDDELDDDEGDNKNDHRGGAFDDDDWSKVLI